MGNTEGERSGREGLRIVVNVKMREDMNEWYSRFEIISGLGAEVAEVVVEEVKQKDSMFRDNGFELHDGIF